MEFIETIKDIAKKGVAGLFRGVEKEITKAIMVRLKRFEKYIIRQFIAIALVLISIAFLGISLTFLLIEYFNISRPIAFASIGIILLIIGIILKIK